MTLNPLDLFRFLTPDGNDPEKLISWRTRLAFVIVLLCISVYIVAPLLLEWRYASAVEAQEIHDQMRAEIVGIKGDLKKLVESDADRTTREKQQEIREVRRSILEIQTQACQAEGALRTALNTQVGELRAQYMALSGEEFPPTPCRDLLGTP